MDTAMIPGYQINEYKIILAPHEDLAKKIMFITEAFNTKYKIEYKVHVPQLILANFKQLHAFEERIVNRLRTVAMGRPPLKVELKDFGSYPSHTIYLTVTSKVPITELVKTIRTNMQRLMKLNADNKPHFMTDAHLTIARKLKPWQFEEGWLELSNQHFTGRFIAKNIILLRKRPGEYKFSPIGSFAFENLPVETKQGELF